MKKILAVDPGLTTGLAYGVHQGGRDFLFTRSEEMKWDDRFDLYRLLQEWCPSIIVCESFRLYAHKSKQQIGSEFPSVRIIGILELSAHLLALPEPVFQPPSIRQNVRIPDEHLPRVQGSEHRKDSYQHLRYFVLTRGPKL
jgi:hypothetical protein